MSTEIKKERIRTGLTQEEAAKKIGVHPTTLNKYESGARYPSGKVLANMAKLFQVPMDSLLKGEAEAIHITKGEELKMIQNKLARVEAEVLELYRENKMLRNEIASLEKKVGSNQKLKTGA